MKITYCYTLVLVMMGWLGCDRSPTLETALKLSGENRQELEYVLDYYAGDSLKEAAARFLITQMPHHYAIQPSDWSALNQVYFQYEALNVKYNQQKTTAWRSEVDEMWQKAQTRTTFTTSAIMDLQEVKSKFLIQQIDLAFKAWQSNVFTRHESFDYFLQYILPYRISEGVNLDNSREEFYERYGPFYNDSTLDFRQVTDSLHAHTRGIVHNDFVATSLPLYRVSDIEWVERALCDHKVWYNYLLTSSLGMGCCIDFVPTWANRGGSHTWNALVLKGEVYPFEPFWEEDRWKYKELYNNTSTDESWGKFRLPKVYRRSYSHSSSPILLDERIHFKDIPQLFLNPFMQDVSHQYFDTVHIHLTLKEGLEQDYRYAYLAVFDGKKGWQPVSYSAISSKGTVTFEGMGKGMLYLPVYFENQTVIPAYAPIEVTSEGEIITYTPSQKTMNVALRSHSPFWPNHLSEQFYQLIRGSYLLGSNSCEKDQKFDTLYCFNESISLEENKVSFQPTKTYRYLTIETPSDSLGLCDLSFYTYRDSSYHILPIVQASTEMKSLVEDEDPSMLFDGFDATGCKMIGSEGKRRITFDLGSKKNIDRLRYLPYTTINIPPWREIDFRVWKHDKWQPVYKKQGENQVMYIDQVPENGIYFTTDKIGRPFTVHRGKIKWF